MDAKPQVIKVSSKRQITIPAKLYQALGFGEHAWCVVVGNGLYLCPADDTAQEPSLDVEAIEREAGAPLREAAIRQNAHLTAIPFRAQRRFSPIRLRKKAPMCRIPTKVGRLMSPLSASCAR